MPGAKIPPPLRFSGWPRGIWNKGSEEAIPLTEMGQQQALRGAVNVDLDRAGKPSRRRGFTLIEALPGLHSLWSYPRFPYMLGVQGSSLIYFDEDESGWGDPVLTGAVGQPVSFAMGAEDVYFSSRSDCGQIDADGAIGAWTAEHPGGQPDVAVNPTVGGLAAGIYQVAITFVDLDGRESGATLPVEVDVPAGGGIALSQFPVAVRVDTAKVRVYCSPPNGEDLYHVMDLPVPASNALIGAHTPGARLDRLFLSPLPPGQCVAVHAAVLHVAVGNVQMWGEPFMHGLSRRATSYARYSADIVLMAGVGQGADGGMFVVTAASNGKSSGRTYFISGANPKEGKRSIPYPHGAVPGTLTFVEGTEFGLQIDGDVPVWVADNGAMVAGLPNGTVTELHGETYDGASNAEHGATALREINGVTHMISVLRGGASTRFGASDQADVEVWKNGVRIR